MDRTKAAIREKAQGRDLFVESMDPGMGEIERGKGNPTLVTAEKLFAALQEDLSSIFDFGSSVLTKEQALQELESLLSSATEEQAQAMLNVAKVMIQKK